MTKVSDVLAKPVISIFDAKIIGTIGNIYFDAKMTKGVILSIFNDDYSEAEESYIELTKLVSLDGDAAVVKASDCVTHEWNTRLGAINPINRPAYTQDGKLLGTVRDVILDGVKAVGFVVDEREIPSDTLLSFSDNILVFNDTGKPIKPPPKKKIPKQKTYQKIELHYNAQNRQSNKLESDNFSVNEATNMTNNTLGNNFVDKSKKSNSILPHETNRETLTDDKVSRSKPQTKIDRRTDKEGISLTGKITFQKSADNKNVDFKEDNFGNMVESIDIPSPLTQSDNNTEIFTALKRASASALHSPIIDTEREEKQMEKEIRESEAEKAIEVPKKIPQTATNVSRTPIQSEDYDNKFDFLKGKLVIQNIYDSKNMVLVRANTLITDDVITLCKRESRLVQLALYATSISR